MFAFSRINVRGGFRGGSQGRIFEAECLSGVCERGSGPKWQKRFAGGVVARTTVLENADIQMKKPKLRARRAECSIQMS